MPETEQEKLWRIIAILIRQTRSGDVQWEKRTSGDDELEHYEYSTANATASISNDGPRGYLRFAIRNADALPIGELKMTQSTSEEFDERLVELHHAARRQVLRIDDTLDSIISELESNELPF